MLVELRNDGKTAEVDIDVLDIEKQIELMKSKNIHCFLTKEQFDGLYKIWDGKNWIYHWENHNLHFEMLLKKNTNPS